MFTFEFLGAKLPENPPTTLAGTCLGLTCTMWQNGWNPICAASTKETEAAFVFADVLAANYVNDPR